jgi:hypothetical protein
MSKYLHKRWLHLLIWGAMVLYFILAPEIYDRYFVQEGKPIWVDAKLPTQVYGYQTHMDRVEIIDDQNGIHQLFGWAFLTFSKSIPAEDYERRVVLLSPKGNYIFTAATLQRIDVQLAYNDLDMDLEKSGFSALIDRNAIKSGLYRLGIIFKRKSNDLTYYVDTDYCVSRTPNQLIMKSVNDSECRSLIFQGTGQPVRLNAVMPIETREAMSWVDSLDATGVPGIFKISGWSFLTLDKNIPAGEYERQVVLFAASGNQVYNADSITRKSVQEYYGNLGMDLMTSGFSALIDSNILNSGAYGISMMLRNTANGAEYYVNTHRCLIRTENDLVLELPGSPACLAP